MMMILYSLLLISCNENVSHMALSSGMDSSFVILGRYY